MHIDIEIGFNDLTPPEQIGMVPKANSYYDQLVCLIKSIKLNWNREVYDYSIYIHHSRHLAEDKQTELKQLGCDIVFNPSEVQEFFNRENILNHKTKGDYTLILDTDMLILNTPKLEFEHEIYAKPAGNPGSLTRQTWNDIYKQVGLTMESNFVPHFNGGVWFIRNECKALMYEYYMKHLDILKFFETKTRHFSVQYYYSLLVKMFDWGIINNKINVYSYESLDADILHYLGVRGYTKGVAKLIDEVNSKYDAV
jgi:hypothetical protein